MKKKIVNAVLCTSLAILPMMVTGCATQEPEVRDVEIMEKFPVNDAGVDDYADTPYVGSWKATSIIASDGTAADPDPGAGDYILHLGKDGGSVTNLGSHTYVGNWIPLTSTDYEELNIVAQTESDEPVDYYGIQLTDEDGTVYFTYTKEPEALTLYDPNLGSMVVFTKI